MEYPDIRDVTNAENLAIWQSDMVPRSWVTAWMRLQFIEVLESCKAWRNGGGPIIE